MTPRETIGHVRVHSAIVKYEYDNAKRAASPHSPLYRYSKDFRQDSKMDNSALALASGSMSLNTSLGRQRKVALNDLVWRASRRAQSGEDGKADISFEGGLRRASGLKRSKQKEEKEARALRARETPNGGSKRSTSDDGEVSKNQHEKERGARL
ncbi:hypothetical protein DFP72DRAFT_1043218 [Ephemerocybe angulata]|uniref:Uncharacterized protein n=1 Tax=Ephemerocybe angulata TaxID=980116 RepID=A0A8H6I6R7_9AGAR|nr:hypothetical protein DFP72DRAFT_1043218 [Tulosesus angulatus]